jgi:hypothetical protein
MASLLFICPTTGGEIASGIETDRYSLQQVRDLPVTLRCPMCNRVHVMTAQQGSLRGYAESADRDRGDALHP